MVISLILIKVKAIIIKKKNINTINIKKYEDVDDDEENLSDLDLFKLEVNERIFDIKIIFSCEKREIYDPKLGHKGRKILPIIFDNN